MPCLVALSQNELHRLEAIQKIRERRLSVVQAAELLRLSRAQVHRLLQAYDPDGAAGLTSKKRGRPSNRRHSEDFRNAALDLVREHYVDFGPTLAAEKLLERHQVGVSKETLRQWMTEAGIWTSRRERKRQLHQPRGRRDGIKHWRAWRPLPPVLKSLAQSKLVRVIRQSQVAPVAAWMTFSHS